MSQDTHDTSNNRLSPQEDGETPSLVTNSFPNIYLRSARSSDDRLLWQWANDPDVRAMSFSSESIPWDDHVQWFAKKLEEPDCFLWIALHRAQPIGYVRFDRSKAEEAVISIGLAPEMRGKGYGKRVIQTACQKLFNETDVHTIHAYIKAMNLASIRAFEGAHFVRKDSQIIQGSKAFHYTYQKS